MTSPVTRLAVLAGVVMLTFVGPAASAHDSLVSSEPADGAQLDLPPAQVELVFSDTPLGLGTEIQITGPAGDLVSVDEARVVDTSVFQPIAPDLPAGEYRVAWRVTSADGHPISGEFAFSVTGGPAAAAAPSSARPDETDSSPLAPVPVWIGIAAVVAIAGSVVVAIRRLRRPPN